MFVAKKKALSEKNIVLTIIQTSKLVPSTRTPLLINVNIIIIGPVHEVLVFISLASGGESGEPAHLRRLARAFTACTSKVGT